MCGVGGGGWGVAMGLACSVMSIWGANPGSEGGGGGMGPSVGCRTKYL